MPKFFIFLIATVHGLRTPTSPIAHALFRGGSLVEANPDYIAPEGVDTRVPPSLISGGSTNAFDSHYNIESFSYSNQISPLERALNFARRLLDQSPTLFFTSAASIFIFCLWQVPAYQRLLQRNFVLSKYNIRHGNYLSLLASAISHTSFVHLALNLFAFLSFGPVLRNAMKTPIWGLTLGSALSGSLSYLLISRLKGGCVGLSSVIFSYLAVFAKLFPSNIIGFYIAGVIPVRMTADNWLQTMLAWSIVFTIIPVGNTAHASHLGGLLFGLAYYECWKRIKYGRFRRSGTKFVPLY